MRSRILYTVFLFTISLHGFGCDCPLGDSIADAYKKANIIFKGKVIKIDTILISDSINVISSSTNTSPHMEVTLRKYLSVKFSVAQFVKGDNAKKVITVMTDAVGTRCGIAFVPNVSYVVYGYLDNLTLVDNNEKVDPAKKLVNIKRYVTSSCTRTTTAVRHELSELRNSKLVT